jgi:hypothetical protein
MGFAGSPSLAGQQRPFLLPSVLVKRCAQTPTFWASGLAKYMRAEEKAMERSSPGSRITAGMPELLGKKTTAPCWKDRPLKDWTSGPASTVL